MGRPSNASGNAKQLLERKSRKIVPAPAQRPPTELNTVKTSLTIEDGSHHPIDMVKDVDYEDDDDADEPGISARMPKIRSNRKPQMISQETQTFVENPSALEKIRDDVALS